MSSKPRSPTLRDALVSKLGSILQRSSYHRHKYERMNTFHIPDKFKKCQIFPAEAQREDCREKNKVEDNSGRYEMSRNSKFNSATQRDDIQLLINPSIESFHNCTSTSMHPDLRATKGKEPLVLYDLKLKCETNGLFEEHMNEKLGNKHGVNGKVEVNYVYLAKDYKRLSRYKKNCVDSKTLCIRCLSKGLPSQKNGEYIQHSSPYCRKIFFPCEHSCVCDSCFNNEKPWKKCPWCHKQVQIVLDKNDMETDEYWNWINEVKPPLPPKFQKHFLRLSRQRISEAMTVSVGKSTWINHESIDHYHLPVGSSSKDFSKKLCKIL